MRVVESVLLPVSYTIYSKHKKVTTPAHDSPCDWKVNIILQIFSHGEVNSFLLGLEVESSVYKAY